MYDILVLCPPDKEMEAGLSYGKAVPVVAVASLIFFNAAMCAQFILLKVDGPAAVAGVCLALSMLGCVVWAARTVREKHKQSLTVAGLGSIVSEIGDMRLDHQFTADEAKERALLVS